MSYAYSNDRSPAVGENNQNPLKTSPKGPKKLKPPVQFSKCYTVAAIAAFYAAGLLFIESRIRGG